MQLFCDSFHPECFVCNKSFLDLHVFVTNTIPTELIRDPFPNSWKKSLTDKKLTKGLFSFSGQQEFSQFYHNSGWLDQFSQTSAQKYFKACGDPVWGKKFHKYVCIRTELQIMFLQVFCPHYEYNYTKHTQCILMVKIKPCYHYICTEMI